MFKRSLDAWLTAINASSTELEGKKILVVTDQPAVSTLLSDLYTDAGARVTCSHRISEAQLLIAWGGYDLVVLSLCRGDRDEMLEFIDWAEPELLDSTLILADNARDHRAAAAIQFKFPGCTVRPFVVADLVGFAAEAMKTCDFKLAA